MLLIALAIWTRRGWDCSNSSTEEERPASDNSSRRGFRCVLVACAPRFQRSSRCSRRCSPWVLTSSATSRMQGAEQLKQLALTISRNRARSSNPRLDRLERVLRSCSFCSSSSSRLRPVASGHAYARQAASSFPTFLAVSKVTRKSHACWARAETGRSRPILQLWPLLNHGARKSSWRGPFSIASLTSDPSPALRSEEPDDRAVVDGYCRGT